MSNDFGADAPSRPIPDLKDWVCGRISMINGATGMRYWENPGIPQHTLDGDVQEDDINAIIYSLSQCTDHEQGAMIDPSDLKIEPWPQRGGGQQVGPGPQGVKVTHQPTGITVTVDCARSQHRNKLIAMDALAGALTSLHLRT